MALNFASGEFTRKTDGTGSQTVTNTDFGGGTPSLVIFFFSRMTADGAEASYRCGLGFGVSSTQRVALSWMGEDNVATTDTAHSLQSAICIRIMSDAVPTLDGQATFTSFSANSFTINWSTNPNPAQATLIKYVMIGGSEVTNVFAGNFTGPAAAGTGTKAFTGVGFQGNLALFFAGENATAIGNNADVAGCLGAAKSSTERCVMAFADDDGTTHTNRAEGYLDNTKCLAIYNPGSGGTPTRDNIADFTSFDSDGFTLDYTLVTTGSVLFNAVILKGTFQAAIASQARPTSTGNQDVTSPGFEPTGLLIIGGTPTANATETAKMYVSIGAGEATGTVRDDCISTHSEATINSDAGMATDATKIYRQLGAGEATEAQADLTAWLANGYRLNWGTADANARLFYHIALGNAASGGQTVSPSGIASTVAFGTAKVSLAIVAAAIASTVAFGTASVQRVLGPTGIASTAAFGTHQVNRNVSPAGIASTVAFGSHNVSVVSPTRFYLPSTGSAAVSPAYAAWDDSSQAAARLRCVTTRISSAMTTVSITDSSGLANRKILWRQYVSDSLAAQTITGTIKGQVRTREDIATANHDQVCLAVKVVSNDGGTLRGTLLALSAYVPANEYALVFTNRKAADGDAASSVACQIGDRIVIEIGTQATSAPEVGVVIGASFGDNSGTDLPEDETTTAANNPWLEFSQQLTFAVAPTGIAPTAAFGTAQVNRNITATGIASTAALGAPKVNLTVAPAGIAPTAAFGTATVSRNVTPSGIASTAALGAAKVNLTVAPSGIAPTAAFGTAKLNRTVAPTGIASTVAIGSHTVSLAAGPQTVSPTGIAPTAALGSPTIKLVLLPSGIVSTAALGSPSLSLTIYPSGIAPTAAFGTHRLNRQLLPIGIASTAAIGSAKVNLTLAPSGIASTAAIGSAKLNLIVYPSGRASTVAFGTHTVVSPQTVSPTAIASSAVFGTATVTVASRETARLIVDWAKLFRYSSPSGRGRPRRVGTRR